MTLAQFSKLNFSDLDAYTVRGYRIFSKIGVKDCLFKVDMFLKNLRPYNSQLRTVYFPLMTVYFEPIDVYFVKTVFFQGPYFNYSGPYILQYNRHGHNFFRFSNFIEFFQNFTFFQISMSTLRLPKNFVFIPRPHVAQTWTPVSIQSVSMST